MDADDLVASYLADVSNEPDGVRRRAAIERLFAESVRYVDQDGAVDGRARFIERIDALAALMGPTMRFTLARPVQRAGEAIVFRWELGMPDQRPVLVGTDMAIVADGLITHLYAVLD